MTRRVVRHAELTGDVPLAGSWAETVLFTELEDGPDRGRELAVSLTHEELPKFVARLVAFSARCAASYNDSDSRQDRVDVANAFVAKVTAQIENTVYRELHGASGPLSQAASPGTVISTAALGEHG